MATGLAPWLRGKGGEGRERGREVALRPDGRAVCERWPPPDVPFWAPSHRLATQPSAQHSPSAACTSSSFLPRVLVPWCLSPRLGAEGLPGPCQPVDFVGSLGLGSALSCSLDASAPPPARWGGTLRLWAPGVGPRLAANRGCFPEGRALEDPGPGPDGRLGLESRG